MVSPCGNHSAWVHKLELPGRFAGWIDATELDDFEFHSFVAVLQDNFRSPDVGLGKCLNVLGAVKQAISKGGAK